MSISQRLEDWCGNVVLKNLKRPFIVALFTLLIILFIIFSTITGVPVPCDKLLYIEHYFDDNIHSGVKQMPVNLTIAYVSNTGVGLSSKEVYRLIKNEGAELVIHSGDFDYEYDPAAFDSDINDVLGKHFPLLAVIGEHDWGGVKLTWTDSPGYQDYLLMRLRLTPNITCSGTIGVNYWCVYRGLFFFFLRSRHHPV